MRATQTKNFSEKVRKFSKISGNYMETLCETLLAEFQMVYTLKGVTSTIIQHKLIHNIEKKMKLFL